MLNHRRHELGRAESIPAVVFTCAPGAACGVSACLLHPEFEGLPLTLCFMGAVSLCLCVFPRGRLPWALVSPSVGAGGLFSVPCALVVDRPCVLEF